MPGAKKNYKDTWRPKSKASEGPKRSVRRMAKAPGKAASAGAGGGQVPTRANARGATMTNKRTGSVSYRQRKNKVATTTTVTKDGKVYKQTQRTSPKRGFSSVARIRRVK